MTAAASAAPACRAHWALACAVMAISLAAVACGPAAQGVPVPPQSSRLEFVGQWGVAGEEAGELAEPAGIATDLNNRVYIADRRTGLLQKFEAGGVPLFSAERSAARSASSIAVDTGGAIYVANAAAGRISIYFPNGDLLRNIRVAAQRDRDGPITFSVAADGTVFVPDPDGGRVQAFSARGRLQRAWRLPPASTGEPARPVAVAADLEDFVYVGDTQTGRILKYTNRGAQVEVWDAPADAAAPLKGLALSRTHLFALRGAPSQAARLEVWTLDGQRILSEPLEDRLSAAAPATQETSTASAPSTTLYLAASRDEHVFLLDSAYPRVLHFRLRPSGP